MNKKNQQCKHCMHCIMNPKRKIVDEYPEDEKFVFTKKTISYICAIKSRHPNAEIDIEDYQTDGMHYIHDMNRKACDSFATTETEREDKIANRSW